MADPESAVLVQSDAPARSDSAAGSGDQADKVKAPWHFWVLVIAVVIYLGWRLVQLITWLL